MSIHSKAPEPFWNFSLTHYAEPGVEDACLALQNRFGLDVNVLLFCVWFGTIRGEIPEALFHDVLTFSRAWSANVTAPLRQARTWIKQNRENPGPPAQDLETLRVNIKALELEAEKIQQTQLTRLGENTAQKQGAGSPEAVRENLARYLEMQQLSPDQDLQSLLQRIAKTA